MGNSKNGVHRWTHFHHFDLSPGSVPEKVALAIVGAGMSGLYCAWRIQQENPDLTIAIFDLLPRTGGRLDSDVVKIGDENVKEEEGGMRFTFDMQELITLLYEMGLQDQIVPFPMGSNGNNRRFFRGVPFTNAESTANNNEIWGDLYNLEDQERGRNPNQIVNEVFNRILEHNPDFKFENNAYKGPEFWQRFRLECKWDGVTRNNWTLWSLFSSMGYSNECITMIYRALGFNGTFLSQMNAGVAYQLLEDFPSNPEFKTLKYGFASLPNALVEQIGDQNIHLKTQATRSDRGENDEGYRLDYVTHPGDQLATGEAGTLTANKIILGLPRLALEKLFVGSNALNLMSGPKARKLWNTLQTTTSQPLLKINLYFERAWWGSKTSGRPAVAYGPNFTDLPLGSVYPFYAIGKVDEDQNGALQMDPDFEMEFAMNYYLTLHQEDPEKYPLTDAIRHRILDISEKKYQKPAALTIYCDYQNINYSD